MKFASSMVVDEVEMFTRISISISFRYALKIRQYYCVSQLFYIGIRLEMVETFSRIMWWIRTVLEVPFAVRNASWPVIQEDRMVFS